MSTLAPTPTYNPDAVALFLCAWFANLPSGELCELRPLNKRKGKRPLPQSWHASQESCEEHIRAAVEHGDDVYIGALPRRIRKGGADAIGAHIWLWADVDYGATGHSAPSAYTTRDDALRAIRDIQLVPTILVETGGGFHVWYALHTPSQPDVWANAARRLRHALNADAAATDPPRILRVPGTANLKTESPRMAVIVEINPEVKHDITGFLSLPDSNDTTEPKQPQLTLVHGGKFDRPYDRAKDIPIADVMRWLGIDMHREGQRIYCACPVHGGSNKSQMIVGGTSNVAHCFGDCGKSFSTVDVVSAVKNVHSRVAVNMLAEDFGFDGFPSHVLAMEPNETVAVPDKPREHGNDWKQSLIPDGKGNAKNTYANYVIILRNYEEFKGRLSYNDMAKKTLLDDRDIGDNDFGEIKCVFEHKFAMSPSFDNLRMAVIQVARDRTFHPLQNYLTSLVWDGEQRIHRVAVDILNAHDAEFPDLPTELVFRWFLAAAARGLKPGCKVDSALVIVGPQRSRKSTFFRVLGGEFFCDTFMDIRNKDALSQLHSAWIYEWGEMERYTHSAGSADIKGFMTSEADAFRAPYERAVIKHPRSSVIVGTTNADDFLDDETGSRRFWVVRGGDKINADLATEWRDQLWAEAVVAVQDGARWWLTEEHESMRDGSARRFEAVDPWAEPVITWMRRQPASDAITTSRILRDAVMVEVSKVTSAYGRRIAKILKPLGYYSVPLYINGISTRIWRRK